MPKDSVVAKYLKRTSVVLILSLAVVGLFSVLRKAPVVHIPEEDRGYIGEIFGGAEFESSGNPSGGGVSSLMDFGVTGAPSVGGNSGGTNAPSSPIPQSDVPVYSGSPSDSSEAPAFIAVPTTSIPKSSTMSDAPLFANQQPAPAGAASAIPALKVPAALEAVPAPVYGSQYQIPQTQKPVQHLSIPDVPHDVKCEPSMPQPVPISTPDVPAIPAVQPPSAILQKTTTFAPTSPPDLYVQPPSWDGPAEPLPSAVITTAANSNFPPVNEPQGNFAALTPQSFSSTDAYPIAVIQDTTAVPVAVPQNTEKQVVFTPPPFKQLPQVAQEYYQTAIKNTVADTAQNTENTEAVKSAAMVLAPQRSASPDEAAKVSFSPQMEKPQKSQTPENTEPVKTLIVSEPSIVEMETVSFTAAPAAVKTTAAEERSVQQVSAVSSPSNESLENVIRFIDSQCREADTGNPEQLRNAFIQLSRLYNRKELSEAERNHLVPILSRIGVDVIFSRSRHILEPAHIVKEGDTVDSVAAAFQISPELLMKINGLTGARPLRPGTPLKVVHGQFDARILLAKGQFVLILGGLYAGQFPVSAGKDIQNIRGEFYVAEKNDSYRGKTLTLNNGIVLCSGTQGGNTLCFADKDASELFDILTENSVIIFE